MNMLEVFIAVLAALTVDRIIYDLIHKDEDEGPRGITIAIDRKAMEEMRERFERENRDGE